jgi:hypothetical protein
MNNCQKTFANFFGKFGDYTILKMAGAREVTFWSTMPGEKMSCRSLLYGIEIIRQKGGGGILLQNSQNSHVMSKQRANNIATKRRDLLNTYRY